MARLTEDAQGASKLTALARALGAALDATLGTYSALLFARSRVTGALLVAATAVDPRALLGGLFAVLAMTVAGRAFGLAKGGGFPYGYNALLVGLGVAHLSALDPRGLLLLILGATLVLFTGAALASVTSARGTPVLSLPFVGTHVVLLALAPLVGAPPAVAHGSWLAVPPELAAPLQTFGSLLFLPRADAGALVLLALLWHSRIATLLALLGGGLAALVAPPSLAGVAALNGALTAVALGGVWFVPSASSFALAAAGSVGTAALTVGLSVAFAHVGVPVLILPFNLAVLGVLLAARQRLFDRRPKSVDFVPGSPEENLAYVQTRLARSRALYAVPFHLPFRGAWECTQGVDGALTHRGPWRHAFDFEVRGDDGELHTGEGATPEDHRCFRLPVVAAADGVVAAVVNDVPDNAVGGQDLERNWGNVVVLRHAPGLCSVVAHLARGSVKVAVGQAVRRGELLGLAGSSGRSPRPHLHFQLQATPELGAATLPCRFTDLVVRGDASESLASAAEPREGQTVRNLEPDEALAALFALRSGEALTWRVAGVDERSETLEHEVDLLGHLVLRSRELGATLTFARGEEGFTAFDPLGASASTVHLLRAALPRVPFDRAATLTWTDYLPVRWSGWSARSRLLDLVAPFVPRTGLEVTYRLTRDGDTVVVQGTSTKTRRGVPVLTTQAVLAAGRGLVSLEVCTGHVRRAAERASHPSVTKNAPRRAAASSPLSVARFFRNQARSFVMQSVRWVGVFLVLVTGCPRGGVNPELPATSAPSEVAATESPASPPAEPTAPLAPASAAIFQRSYDDEAAGKLAAALADLDGVSAEGPARYLLELRRGWLTSRLGKSADAVLAYARASALSPASLEAKQGSLAALLTLGKMADAETAAREILLLDPTSYAATLRLGFALYSQGKLALAEAAYRKVAALYPGDVDARVGLGFALLDQGKKDEARVAFEDVLAIAPKNALALKGASAVSAASTIDGAAAFQRSYDDEALGKLDPALADLAPVHAQGNAAYVLELRRGWLLFGLGKHADAVAAYARASALAPAALEPKLGALAPLSALRRFTTLEALAKDALTLDAANYTATLRLAYALYNQARFVDAERLYRVLGAAYPGDLEVQAGVGWSLLKRGKKAEAEATFGVILAVAPKHALALEGLKALKAR